MKNPIFTPVERHDLRKMTVTYTPGETRPLPNEWCIICDTKIGHGGKEVPFGYATWEEHYRGYDGNIYTLRKTMPIVAHERCLEGARVEDPTEAEKVD